MTRIEHREQKWADRAAREQRRIETGAVTAARIQISEERTGLPGHEFKAQTTKLTRRFFGRLLGYESTMLIHKADCGRCAMERERMLANRDELL